MYRKKIKIKSNKLSWEESNKSLSCDKKNCKLEGKYKAPKSKINLRDYYFFCLLKFLQIIVLEKYLVILR